MTVAISSKVLGEVADYFARFPDATEKATVLAVNRAVRDAEVATRREAYKQVAFPKGFVEGRMSISKYATRNSPFAILSGDNNVVSLRNFTGGATFSNSRGKVLNVRVDPRRTVSFKRSDGSPSAFIIKLANGNEGLAMRLPDGETPSEAYRPKQLTRDNGKKLLPVWLLYGPSVGQTMRSIYVQKTPEIGEAARREFLRQFARITSRG